MPMDSKENLMPDVPPMYPLFTEKPSIVPTLETVEVYYAEVEKC